MDLWWPQCESINKGIVAIPPRCPLVVFFFLVHFSLFHFSPFFFKYSSFSVLFFSFSNLPRAR